MSPDSELWCGSFSSHGFQVSIALRLFLAWPWGLQTIFCSFQSSVTLGDDHIQVLLHHPGLAVQSTRMQADNFRFEKNECIPWSYDLSFPKRIWQGSELSQCSVPEILLFILGLQNSQSSVLSNNRDDQYLYLLSNVNCHSNWWQ